MKKKVITSKKIKSDLSKISDDFKQFTKFCEAQKTLYLKHAILEPDTMSQKVSELKNNFNFSESTPLEYMEAFFKLIPELENMNVENDVYDASDNFFTLIRKGFPKKGSSKRFGCCPRL